MAADTQNEIDDVKYGRCIDDVKNEIDDVKKEIRQVER